MRSTRRYGLLVLFIDDDRDYREVMRLLLEGIGFAVVVAADGIEFGIRMRGDMRFRRVPLIAVTGRRDRAALLDSWGAAFDGYLDKPVTADQRAGVIERFARGGRKVARPIRRTA